MLAETNVNQVDAEEMKEEVQFQVKEKEVTGIDDAGLKGAVEDKQEWKPLAGWENIPVEKDGWMMSHNAIRLDMEDMKTLLELLCEKTQGEQEKWIVHAWMGDNLQSWYTNFVHIVHSHHDHEEDIFFPAMNKRCKVPPKMSVDHKELIRLLKVTEEKCEFTGNMLRESAGGDSDMKALHQAVQEFYDAFLEMKNHMEQHLAEEEVVGIPLFRAHFTPKDAKALEKKIIATMPKIEMGWFLRPLEDDQKQDWMKNVAGMPGFVIRFIFWPLVKKGGKYDQQYTNLLTEIAQGKQIPQEKPQSFCSIQ